MVNVTKVKLNYNNGITENPNQIFRTMSYEKRI